MKVTINGTDYEYKRAVVRLVHEAAKLQKRAEEAVGKIVFEGNEVTPSILGILLDEEKTEKFRPFWKEYVNLIFVESKGIDDITELTTEEVEKIQEGFSDAATPMLRRFAALKSSPDTVPSQP